MSLSNWEKEFLYRIEKRCEEKDAYAMEEWATFYTHNHPELLDPEKIDRAIKYFEFAIRADIPRAMLNLGALYYSGTVIEQNYPKAVELYTMASQSGDEEIASTALTNLGYCYYYGRIGQPDYELAFHYYMQAATFYQSTVALYKIGDMYRSGRFIRQNSYTAYLYYKRAMAFCDTSVGGCYPDVALRLAEYLIEGKDGVQKDFLTALRYLTVAESILYDKIYRQNDPFAKGTLKKINALLQKAKYACKMEE